MTLDPSNHADTPPIGPPDYFAQIVSSADSTGSRTSVGKVLLMIASVIGALAFGLTATAFAGDDGTGLAGLVFFVTGPMFIVAFLVGIPGACLTLYESNGPAPDLDGILKASCGETNAGHPSA